MTIFFHFRYSTLQEELCYFYRFNLLKKELDLITTEAKMRGKGKTRKIRTNKWGEKCPVLFFFVREIPDEK